MRVDRRPAARRELVDELGTAGVARPHLRTDREAGMRPYCEADGVTLYHGDCREVIPTLGLTADCIVADPPYGETSLAWDRWPNGWPTVAAQATQSMWCFGSLRMFLDRRDEFVEWKLSQDVVWEKHNGSSLHGDRFRRVHEHGPHWYRGDWAAIYHEPPLEVTGRRAQRIARGTTDRK